MKHKQTKATSIPAYVKVEVFSRDRGRCVYCGSPYGQPNAHFIPRSKGGLGIPENILTLCLECHHRFDFGRRQEREGMKKFFAEYLQSKYPDWDETKLIYHKYKEENNGQSET